MKEAQGIVIAWEVAAAIGIIVQVLLLWEEWRSLQALKRDGRNGPARLVAVNDMRTDAIGLIVMLIVLATGMLAHVVVHRGDPPFSGLEQWALEHFWRVLGYGVLASIVLLLIKAIWKRYDRHELLRVVAKKEEL